MEKKVILVVSGLLLLGSAALFAGEPVKKDNIFKQTLAIEKRGFVNLVTCPGEVVYTFKSEKKAYPKVWPATYLPRLLMNSATRIGSSVYDIFLLPWYAPAMNDPTPLTRHFDMPDYVWKKE